MSRLAGLGLQLQTPLDLAGNSKTQSMCESSPKQSKRPTTLAVINEMDYNMNARIKELAVKAKLYAAIVAGLNDPAVKPKLLELGFEIVANTPEQFTAYQASEFARWAKLIQSRNIKAD